MELPTAVIPFVTSITDQTPTLQVESAHPASSNHRPRVLAWLGYSPSHLFVRFDVQDQYVLARHSRPNSGVCQDSCVELFVRPPGVAGYFNFEFNCAGTTLAQFNTLDRQTSDLDQRLIRVQTSMPGLIEQEITTPTRWQLSAAIAFDVFRPHAGAPTTGATWRGNLYKCADHSSHPHWLSWSPIGPTLSFHQIERFGTLRFG